MDTPANLSPVSLADIGTMLDAKVDKILSQQKEDAAKRDTEAAKRDAERDAALQAKMSDLRSDMEKRDIKAAERDAEAAKREKRLTTITLVAIGAMAAILGYLQHSDDAPAPTMASNPPQVIYITPPAAVAPPAIEPR